MKFSIIFYLNVYNDNDFKNSIVEKWFQKVIDEVTIEKQKSPFTNADNLWL